MKVRVDSQLNLHQQQTMGNKMTPEKGGVTGKANLSRDMDGLKRESLSSGLTHNHKLIANTHTFSQAYTDWISSAGVQLHKASTAPDQESPSVTETPTP